jgi:hypothetical protein
MNVAEERVIWIRAVNRRQILGCLSRYPCIGVFFTEVQPYWELALTCGLRKIFPTCLKKYNDRYILVDLLARFREWRSVVIMAVSYSRARRHQLNLYILLFILVLPMFAKPAISSLLAALDYNPFTSCSRP